MVTKISLSPGRWLRADDFGRVEAEHIREAVHALSSGSVDHPFAESTDYDVLLDDGTRLAPKAVFGVAARRALGIEVRPKDFRGGEGSRCFGAVRAANFQIVRKLGTKGIPPDSADVWVEGDPRRRTHLVYERDREAAQAKKNEVKEVHGKLKCEKCGLVPVELYEDESGEACIEVHHRVPLSSLRKRRITKCEDLMCVCANCHRVIHARMALEARRDGPNKKTTSARS